MLASIYDCKLQTDTAFTMFLKKKLTFQGMDAMRSPYGNIFVFKVTRVIKNAFKKFNSKVITPLDTAECIRHV